MIILPLLSLLLHVLNLANLGMTGIIAKPRKCAYTQLHNYDAVLGKNATISTR